MPDDERAGATEQETQALIIKPCRLTFCEARAAEENPSRTKREGRRSCRLDDASIEADLDVAVVPKRCQQGVFTEMVLELIHAVAEDRKGMGGKEDASRGHFKTFHG